MLYSCALVFFLSAACCLTTFGIFSDRWMLVDASVSKGQGTDQVGNVTKGTVFVAMGLWETRRVPFYHYFYHHHTHAVLVYHETDFEQRQRRRWPPPPVAMETPDAPDNSTGLRADWRWAAFRRPAVSEATLQRLAGAHSGALVAVRVLLFACLGLCLGAAVKLAIDACHDQSVIRHRYKERALAYTLTALCGTAFVLSVMAWSVFLGTLYHGVVSEGETSEVLNSGFICSVLASLTAAVAAIMAACSITADE